MEVLGWDWLGHAVHDVAHAVAVAVPALGGFLEWLVKAVLDGVFGLALGLLLIPVATKVIAPVWGAVAGLWPGAAKGGSSH
jgi:predicted DNA repair protein MutK